MFRENAYFLENGKFIFNEISGRFGKLIIDYSKKVIRWKCKECGIIFSTLNKNHPNIIMDIIYHLRFYDAIIYMRHIILRGMFYGNEYENDGNEYEMFRSNVYTRIPPVETCKSKLERLRIKDDDDVTGDVKYCIRIQIRTVRPNCDKCCICNKYIMEFNYHSRLFAGHIVDHLINIRDMMQISCNKRKEICESLIQPEKI